ncbi:unnamed protein product [Clavelina lepadiformis]|uniref:Uncharacterized protein n=1 Tax=Clavelina lepadiformis TaxID=159417 RepID=A0ABP0F500_CLALP
MEIFYIIKWISRNFYFFLILSLAADSTFIKIPNLRSVQLQDSHMPFKRQSSQTNIIPSAPHSLRKGQLHQLQQKSQKRVRETSNNALMCVCSEARCLRLCPTTDGWSRAWSMHYRRKCEERFQKVLLSIQRICNEEN